MGRYHIFSPQNIVNKPSVNAMPQARNCRNVCEITTNLGNEVYHYGAQGSEVVCTEHIDVIFEYATTNGWKLTAQAPWSEIDVRIDRSGLSSE